MALSLQRGRARAGAECAYGLHASEAMVPPRIPVNFNGAAPARARIAAGCASNAGANSWKRLSTGSRARAGAE